ncbi:MAG: hypothetical protein WC897_05455 [Candidatus Gracilibacteria bacterium]
MLFHPFKYQLFSTLLEKQENMCTVKIRRGSQEGTLYFPNALIPAELEPGQNFILNLEPEETANQNQTTALKALLEELIR